MNDNSNENVNSFLVSPMINLSVQITNNLSQLNTVNHQPRIRTKKTKEKQTYDVLQIDEQIRLFFSYEKNKLHEYRKRLISMLHTFDKALIPYGIDKTVINDINETILKEHIHPTNSAEIEFTYREF